jgi:hypothetical protein
MACAPNDADENEPAPDSQFESYYDQDSGTWSLRRVASSRPPLLGDEEPTSHEQ